MREQTALPRSPAFLAKVSGNLQKDRCPFLSSPKKSVVAKTVSRDTDSPLIELTPKDDTKSPFKEAHRVYRSGARAPTPSQRPVVSTRLKTREPEKSQETHPPLTFSMEKEPAVGGKSREPSTSFKTVHRTAGESGANPKKEHIHKQRIVEMRVETWRSEVPPMKPESDIIPKSQTPSRIPIYCGRGKKARPQLNLLIPKDEEILVTTLNSPVASGILYPNSSSTIRPPVPKLLRSPARKVARVVSPPLRPSPAIGAAEKLNGLKRRLSISTGLPEEVLLSQLKQFDCAALPDYLVKELKVEEINERIRIIEEEIRHLREYGNRLEWETLEGWINLLVEELRHYEQGLVKPSSRSVQNFMAWIYKTDTTALYPSYKEAFRPQPDEFLNLECVGRELMRDGFSGWEAKMIRYWTHLYNLDTNIASQGDAIITHYLEIAYCSIKTKLRKRRMWYLCLDHYVHWKEGVSHYAMALKMMNLMLVFHDLWGWHLQEMSEGEKLTYEELGGKLHGFAFQFVAPCDVNGNGPSWEENECMYCFSSSTLSVVEVPPHTDSIWSWFLVFSLVMGYGKYHTVLLRLLAQGRDPSYINQMFEHGYYRRLYDMMLGRGRVQRVLQNCIASPTRARNGQRSVDG